MRTAEMTPKAQPIRLYDYSHVDAFECRLSASDAQPFSVCARNKVEGN